MSKQEITVTARLKIKKTMLDEAARGLKELAAKTRKEPGCIKYELHRCLDDDTMLLIYEVWKQKDDIDKHFETAHFKAWRKLSQDMTAEPTQVTLWENIS
jgi:autoinducer 2-degrading protein